MKHRTGTSSSYGPTRRRGGARARGAPRRGVQARARAPVRAALRGGWRRRTSSPAPSSSPAETPRRRCASPSRRSAATTRASPSRAGAGSSPTWAAATAPSSTGRSSRRLPARAPPRDPHRRRALQVRGDGADATRATTSTAGLGRAPRRKASRAWWAAARWTSRGRLERIGPRELSCVMIGETGTGKEVVAREVHRTGPSKG